MKNIYTALFYIITSLTIQLYGQGVAVPSFDAFTREIEEAVYKDLESPATRGMHFQKVLAQIEIDNKSIDEILQKSVETIANFGEYETVASTVLSHIFYHGLNRSRESNLDISKVIQNLLFRAYPICYRLYGRENETNIFYGNLTADLMRGLFLYAEKTGSSLDDYTSDLFTGAIAGANQVTNRLQVPVSQFLPPLIKSLVKKHLDSVGVSAFITLDSFVSQITKGVLVELKQQVRDQADLLPLVIRPASEAVSYYCIQNKENAGMYVDLLTKGIMSGVWNSISREIESIPVEGILLASYVGNIGVMNKANRQFVPRDNIFPGLELVGDYSFLTSQYSSAVILLGNEALIQLSKQTQVHIDYDGSEIHVRLDYGNLFYDTLKVSEDKGLFLHSNTGFIQLSNSMGEFSMTPHSISNNTSGVLKMLRGQGLFKGNNGRFVPVKDRQNLHLVVDQRGDQLVAGNVFPMSSVEQSNIDGFSIRTEAVRKRVVQLKEAAKSGKIEGRSVETFYSRKRQNLNQKLLQDKDLLEENVVSLLLPVGGQILETIVDAHLLLNKPMEEAKPLISKAIQTTYSSIFGLNIENSLKIETLVGSVKYFIIHGLSPSFSMGNGKEYETVAVLSSAILEELVIALKGEELSSPLILDVVKRQLVRSTEIEAGIYRKKEEKIQKSLQASFEIAKQNLIAKNVPLSDADIEQLVSSVDIE